MPMNPRLLRPTSSTLDPAAAVYLNAVAQADGQQLEPAVRKAINDFVIGCKRDGIWDAIKASCILMGARTLAGALTPLVGSAPTNNGPFVSGDYNRKNGLAGNASSKYLDSNRANNADPQNSNHNSAYAQTVLENGTAYMGASANLSGANNVFIDGFGNFSFRNRTNGFSSAASKSTGFVGVSRSSSSQYLSRSGGAGQTFVVTSQSPSSDNVFVFARNNGSGSAQFVTAARLAFYSIGESLDLALLDTRVSALYTAIGAAI